MNWREANDEDVTDGRFFIILNRWRDQSVFIEMELIYLLFVKMQTFSFNV